jgi:hypothetical protein
MAAEVLTYKVVRLKKLLTVGVDVANLRAFIKRIARA